MPETISVEQAGKRLGINRMTAYRAVKRGFIPSIKLGKRIVIPLGAFEKLLNEGDCRNKASKCKNCTCKHDNLTEVHADCKRFEVNHN